MLYFDKIQEKIMTDKKQVPKIKFLHCSDIHLDSPYTGLTPEKSDERRQGLRTTFMRMMEYVRGGGINYVLISGDLFDIEYATNSTAELLIREFRNCPDTKFIIAPGKSDFYKDNPIYTSERLPDNCYIFSSDRLSRFDFEDDKLTIYGWAFMTESHVENPLYDKTADDISKINIVCGYADLDADITSKDCPIATADLQSFGADYYAFGSRHEGTDFESLGDSMYAYAGALEASGFDDPGIGGAKLITVKYDSGELSIDAKSMAFGRIAFKEETIDVTAVDSGNEIINRISKLVAEKKYSSETALKIELVGSVDPRFIVPRNLDNDAFGLYSFEIVDKTLPTYKTESFLRDMTVKGEVYRTLLPMLNSSDEEERLVAARAFREALAALENRDVEI